MCNILILEYVRNNSIKDSLSICDIIFSRNSASIGTESPKACSVSKQKSSYSSCILS